MKKVVIRHTEGQEFTHQFRNFGEDLWRALKEDRRVRISLGDIDSATNEFSFLVSSSSVSLVVNKVEKIIREHLVMDRIQTVIDGNQR